MSFVSPRLNSSAANPLNQTQPTLKAYQFSLQEWMAVLNADYPYCFEFDLFILITQLKLITFITIQSLLQQ